MTAALALRDVTIRHGLDEPPILRGLSLELAPGERVALLGLNGAGKTTLLSAVVGLVPHEGVIEVAGVEVTSKNLDEVRDRIGFLFNAPEDQLLFPRVIDDVAFGLRRRQVPVAEATARAIAALDALGAEQLAHRSVLTLSHGQKQRVALAGALVTEPTLLLLDEPSAALDPPGKRRLAKTLRGLSAALLLTTHDRDFAAACCTRTLLLADGHLTDTPPSW